MPDNSTYVQLQSLEKYLGEVLPVGQPMTTKPEQGWLRLIRTGNGISQKSIATKLGVSRQAYAQLETSEQSGAISLKSLERAAATMDCDLIYFVVPRSANTATHDHPMEPKIQPQPKPKKVRQAVQPEVSTDLFQSGIINISLETNPSSGD